MKPQHARRRLPWLLLLVVAALMVVGLVFLHSSTLGTSRSGLVARQGKAIGVALPLFLVACCLHLRTLARLAWPLYLLAVSALVLVLFFGIEINHARRWFAVGPVGFHLQPSELAKVIFVLAMARSLEFRRVPRSLWSWIGPALLTALPFLLIRAQPDLGTAILFLPPLAAMMYVAGARKLHYALALLLVGTAVPALYFSPLLKDYQKERIRTFLTSVPAQTEKVAAARRSGDVEEAQRLEKQLQLLKRNAGYQSHAAQVAIGSGGWQGKGLGLGPQNRLNYLPERHSDFVFAVICEEWGLRGGSLLIGLYVLLVALILLEAARRRDTFGRLVCVGSAASLGVQAFANIGMCTGLLPITGMPLPFLSQGGSSMLSCLAFVGIVVAVTRAGREDAFLYRTPRSKDPFSARSS